MSDDLGFTAEEFVSAIVDGMLSAESPAGTVSLQEFALKQFQAASFERDNTYERSDRSRNDLGFAVRAQRIAHAAYSVARASMDVVDLSTMETVRDESTF